ncbi:MAG: GNAT family N-acetyltransferase [Alphaproteobacteria bacterium]|nr:GNAT family N-acetyltransferase [Alphaproteobacteria bacterium]
MLDLKTKTFEKFSLPEILTGQNCIFERRQSKHNEELFHLITDSKEFLRKYLFWVDDTKTLEDVKQVTEIFSKNWDNRDSFEYVFLDKKTGEMVGAGGIHTISYMNKWAEYGYYLSKNAVKKGYATDFVKTLEKELFIRGIHRLVIECDKENTASAKVAERCGFSFEGCLKGAKFAYGEYRDEFVYAKINPQDENGSV